MMKPLIILTGPTAVGKTALSVRLAKAVGGEIISADSMQVYGDLRILTARPTPEEEMRVPHRLYGHVDGAADYSVARWIADAAAAMATLVVLTSAVVSAGFYWLGRQVRNPG